MLPISKCFWHQATYLQRTSEGPRDGLGVRHGEDALESLATSRRQSDVASVWPFLNLGDGLFTPLDEIAVEVGNERRLTFDEVKPMWERPACVKQFFDERRSLGMQRAGMARGGFQRLAKLFLCGLVAEEHPEKSLDFDQRCGRLATEPFPESRTAFRGDGVASGLLPAPVDYLGGGVSTLDQPLELRVQVSVRSRPEEVHAAFDLSHDLVRRPRFYAQQTEKRERCGGRL